MKVEIFNLFDKKKNIFQVNPLGTIHLVRTQAGGEGGLLIAYSVKASL